MCAGGKQARRACRFLAGGHDGAKATNAHGRCECQQDGAHHMGAADAQRGLQSSGPGHGIAPGRARGVGGRRRTEGGYGITVGETGLEKPVTGKALSKRAKQIWIQPANSPTGQRHQGRNEGRTDDRIRLRAGPNFTLASEGASTEAYRQTTQFSLFQRLPLTRHAWKATGCSRNKKLPDGNRPMCGRLSVGKGLWDTARGGRCGHVSGL